MIEPLTGGVVNGGALDVAFVSSYPTVGLTIGQTISRPAPLEVYEVTDWYGMRLYNKVQPGDYGLPNFVRLTTNFLLGDYGDTLRFHPTWRPDDDDTPDRDEIQLPGIGG
jgi:hypothetical protein